MLLAIAGWSAYPPGYPAREEDTPQHFGAIADDDADDTDAFIKASQALHAVRVPPGTYVLSKPLKITDGARWNFDGVTLLISDQPAFVAINAKNWSIAGDVTIRGAENTALAVDIQNPRNARIGRIEIDEVGGTALKISGEKQELPRSNTLGIGRLILMGNGRGLFVQAGAGAEFVTVQKIEALGNKLAVEVGAGNFQLMGGNVVDNHDGILLTGGHNNGHGMIRGVTVAHNTGFNLRADGLTYGYTIDASHIYGGDGTGEIEIENSTGVTITNGIIDARIETIGGGLNSVTGNYTGGRQFSAPASDSLIVWGNYG